MIAKPRFCIVAIALIGSSLCAQTDRIAAQIGSRDQLRLDGAFPLRTLEGADQGPVDAATVLHLRLSLGRSAVQSADFQRLLSDQRNPASLVYRKWLTPEEYADRFGLSANDIGRITAWLQSEGFTVVRVSRGRDDVAFTGTAAQIPNSFGTAIHRYLISGEAHYSNDQAPAIPAALRGVVINIQGMDDFRPKPMFVKRSSSLPRPEYGALGGSGAVKDYLGPSDLAAIYDINPLYAAGINGAGQTIAIVGQASFSPLLKADIQEFRSGFNLPPNEPLPVTDISLLDPPNSPDEIVEAELDLEWAGAIAQNAKVVYVYSQSAFLAMDWVIDNNLAPILGASFADCETQITSLFAQTMQGQIQRAHSQGITVIAAAGDTGAAGCDEKSAVRASQGLAVTFPAGIPEVTAVGGTEFNEGSRNSYYWGKGAATGYIPEMVWNDSRMGTDLDANGIEAGGGGVSAKYTKPPWQTGHGVPADGFRDVPDIALTASADHDGYIVCVQGSCANGINSSVTAGEVIGGTSAGTPVFAGILALLEQYQVSNGVQTVPAEGNINPVLYGLARSGTTPFHDITSGSNIVPCVEVKGGPPNCPVGRIGYEAGPGYDLASGLGSVDAFHLATLWSTVAPAVSNATVTTASNAGTAFFDPAENVSVQLHAGVTSSAGPVNIGTVTFSVVQRELFSEVLVGRPVTSATLNGVATAPYLLPAGSAAGVYFIVASYNGGGDYRASSDSSHTLTVPNAPTATVVSFADVAYSATNQNVNLSATVSGARGSPVNVGIVKFAVTLNGAAIGSPVIAAAVAGVFRAAYALPGGSAAGSYAVTAVYSGSPNYNGSVGSSALKVFDATKTTVSNAVAAFSSGNQNVKLSAKVGSNGGTVTAGTVVFQVGLITHIGLPPTIVGSPATVAVSNGIATATYLLPGGSVRGVYAIRAVYSGGGNFTGSADDSNTLTIE